MARARDYDIIDAWLFPADLLAAVFRPYTRTPIVISGRRNLHPHDQFGPLGRPVDAFINGRVDAVVANSAAAAEVARTSHHVNPNKLQIIRNGVEAAAAATASERRARRAGLGTGDGDFVIGCVANHVPVKRLDMLIGVFASLCQLRPDLRLVLVGDGDLRRTLEDQVAELGLDRQVRFQGAEADPIPLYAAFDLVVQASRSEGLPNAILEAAAAGRPIVATDAGGTNEIIVDGHSGLLVPIDNEAALAAAMRRAIEDSGLRESMGAAAQAHVRRAFGMDRFVQEFSALYEELAVAKGLRG